MAVGVLIAFKIAKQAAADVVVAHHQKDHGQLGVHPGIARPPTNANAPPQPNTEDDGWHRQLGGESHQFFAHQQQSITLCM